MLFILIQGPVGSTKPKFPNILNTQGFLTKRRENVALLCPAQGFPVPSHRYNILSNLILLYIA